MTASAAIAAPRVRRLSFTRSPALEALVPAAVSVLVAAWVLRLWRTELTVPLRYAPVDDTKFYLMLVKGIIEHGTYLSNPTLGAPFGQHLIDYPQGADNLNLLVIRGLALFSTSPALVTNLFLLFTYAAAAFTAHLVMRALGVGLAGAGVAAVLFALLPYHFFRGESHLLLSAYYGVPLAAYLFLALLGDRPLFARTTRRRGVAAWVSGRSLTTIVLCGVIGSDNLYYAVFALVLILGALSIALARRRWGIACSAVVVTGLIVATLGANLAPTLLYQAAHGANPRLERTAAADEHTNEAFTLTLPNLILPTPVSTVSPLVGVARRYDHAIAPGYCEACYGGVGGIASAGLLVLALGAATGMIGVGAWFRSRRLIQNAAVGVAVALVVGTAGGLSSLIEVTLTPDIRAWNRISVVIAFLSLLAAAVLLDALTARLGSRRHGRPLAVVMLTAVLLFGVLEQTSGLAPSGYVATEAQWRSDGRFVATLQARLPVGATVFQLPYVPFPEGYPNTPVGGTVATYATKYEALRGYLHSSTLRWSYGAIKGRPADWSAALATEPVGVVVPAVAGAGFDGIWVDPAGYEPPIARRVSAGLRELLGPPLLSPAGDLQFFDLRPYRARLTARDRSARAELARLGRITLHPRRPACAANPVLRAAATPLVGRLPPVQRVLAGITDPGCRR